MLSPPSRHGCGYSAFEDRKIVRFLCERDAWELVRGNKIWQIMEKSNICPERSYHSLRNRFLKSIMFRLRSDYKQILQEYDVKLPSFLEKTRPKMTSLSVFNKKSTIPIPKNCQSHGPGATHPSVLSDDGWIEVHSGCSEVPPQVPVPETDNPREPEPAAQPEPNPLPSAPSESGPATSDEIPASHGSQNSYYPSQQWELLRARLIPIDKHPELIILSPTKKTPEKSPPQTNSKQPAKDADGLFPITNSEEGSTSPNSRRDLFRSEASVVQPDIENLPNKPTHTDALELAESLTPEGICPADENVAPIVEVMDLGERAVAEIIALNVDRPTDECLPDNSNPAIIQTITISRRVNNIRNGRRKNPSVPRLLQILKNGRKLLKRNRTLMSLVGHLVVMIESDEEKRMELATRISRRDAQLRKYLMTKVLHRGDSPGN